ncbi:MAG: GGDEF domain-containing response regulator [Nitrospirae bacterium]|nr:GGDEF domain-containing response regulator [Nitrospirota bacterium]
MVKQSSIIIVDDDESFLNMLKERFVLEGYRCETATSAESALELIGKTFFDIMLTDISFPGMKGFELTEQARKLRPEMMVIIMTGFIDEFSYDGAIEAGASDFIKKPFTFKELKVRIEHAGMQEKQRVMAITDELTGLCNRRGFFTLAEQQLNLAKRQKKGICMLYADVDNLKGINDTLGHQKGDLALIDTSNLLKATFRESDIIARIGGDEFVVIPVGPERDNVEIITARFQRNLKDHNAKRSRSYKLSMSFGVAYFDPENPCSIDELLAQGDKMMYDQKRLKRKDSRILN